ncbi:hypothetical protein Tco_0267241 [Tanacetum coccineum]
MEVLVSYLGGCLNVASAPLTPLFKPGGGIRPIAVGNVLRRLVSKVSVVMIDHSLDGYLVDLQFGAGVSGVGEAILHDVNRLIEDRVDDVGLLMLLVDFENAFNLVDRELDCITGATPYGHAKGCNRAWYLDDGIIVGDTLVVGKVLELIMEDGPRCGLHLNVHKTEVFLPKDDPRSRLEGVFPPNIAWPLHGVKLLGGLASVDFNFISELVMKKVAKTIGLVDAVSKINNPQCELFLLLACTGISKLYFAMRTCSPWVFEMAQRSFDAALRCALERIVTTSGPGFDDWQWRLATLPFAFGGLGVYSAVASRPTLEDALCVFNTTMEIDLLSNPSEITAPKLMKKLAYIYFTCVTQTRKSNFSLSPRQMALRQSQMEDHTSDWLVVLIFGLGQTMNACSMVFTGDIYGDHAVSCAGIIEGLRCVDLTGSSPLRQTELADFVPGRAVMDAAHRKRVKYEAKCADIGYGFLPFSFSSLGELEKDVMALLKWIRKFSLSQDIGTRAAVHIFNRISFDITKGVRVQIVYRLPSIFLNPMNF